MEEPLWKIARFASETGLLNYRPILSAKSVKLTPNLKEKKKEEEAALCKNKTSL